MKNNSIIILGLSIAIGLIILGFCIKSGLNSFSDKERIVTVKGLAEKLIKANSANIDITSQVSGDTPNELVAKLDSEIEKIKDMLESKNYKDMEISELNYYDSKEYHIIEWSGGNQIKVKKDRYYLSKKITIITKDVENTENIKQDFILTLINNNITADVFVLYNFPELNNIKPELIAESTKNARAAGEQFANDSKSKLGKIKTASQGQISIANRYYDEESNGNLPEEPYFQKVRVVSSIVFFLED